MALTKGDLQAIRELMREEIRAEIRAETAPINVRLDKVDSRLDTMQGRIDTMQGSIDTMQGSIDTMQGSIDILKKDMAHHNHYVEPLLKAVKDAVDGLQERQQQVDRMEGKIDSHDHRIWALEQAIKAK